MEMVSFPSPNLKLPLTRDLDCVSFKPNSTNILIQNLFCNGSHGISVGSLGQYVGEFDIVQNIYVYNISMHNASVITLPSPFPTPSNSSRSVPA